mgnify:CR=1 FL=1
MLIDPRWYQDGLICECIKLYTSSLIRLCYLSSLHPNDHPILILERQINEQTINDLRTSILLCFPNLNSAYIYLRWWIKSTISIRLHSEINNLEIHKLVTLLDDTKFDVITSNLRLD